MSGGWVQTSPPGEDVGVDALLEYATDRLREEPQTGEVIASIQQRLVGAEWAMARAKLAMLRTAGLEITLWLQVVPPGPHQLTTSRGDLWTKKITTAFLPDTTHDDIYLWPDPEGDAASGPAWSAYRRYMDANGDWHVNLSRMVLDPDEPTRQQVLSFVLNPPTLWRPWYTGAGDPGPNLERGGWRRYGQD